MSDAEKNHQAYEDCANFEEPSMQNDEVYMKAYQYWTEYAGFPADNWELA